MTKKIISIFIAMIFMLSMALLPAEASSSAEYQPYEITEFDTEYEGYKPIPLLVVVINFDADGDGKNAVTLGKSVTDRNEDSYGEQWSTASDSYWHQILFGDSGKTMKNYFKSMSKGDFYFYPATESCGTADDGIAQAVVNMMHQNASTGSSTSQYGGERLKALQYIDQYIDFASYDKDGNGFISFDELAISYIISGYNSKWGTSGKTSSVVWGMNNFEVSGSSWSVELDNVVMLNGTRNGRFTYNGEMMAPSTPIQFGTIAHELGHVLGASDLYTYGGYTWCGGPGDTALQGGGSSLSRPGELAGQSPSAIDPYYLLEFGFEKSTVINDGTYTLYSRESRKGAYNILRINTANPSEYYLIENRYCIDNTSYDGIAPGARGIMIWHIDESIMNSYSLPNCYKGAAHAPGDTPLYPNGATGGSGYNAWDSSDGVFKVTNYTFAGVGTWSTLMDDEEMELFKGITIKVDSSAATEMAITVSGTVKLAPTAFANAYTATTDSITLKGTIKAMNNSTLTGIKATISSTEDFSKIIEEVYLKPESDGTFTYVFGSLKEKTNYYFKVETTGSNGTSVRTFNGYTKATPKERTDDYIVYMYKGLTAANRAYEKIVKCGEVLSYTFPMEKSLEKFAGWYLDPEYTEKYNMSFTKTTCEEMYIYARWIVNENAVTLNISGATPVYPLFAIRTGEHFEEPEIKSAEGKTFKGWFADPEYTVPFNFDDPIDEAGEITVYALWENNAPAETTETTSTVETTAPIETTTTGESTAEPSENKGGTTVIIVVVAIVVIAAAAAAVVIVTKKKKK